MSRPYEHVIQTVEVWAIPLSDEHEDAEPLLWLLTEAREFMKRDRPEFASPYVTWAVETRHGSAHLVVRGVIEHDPE